MLYFLYISLSILLIGEIILFLLYPFLLYYLLRKRFLKWITFICIIFVTFILWTFAIIAFERHIHNLNDLFFKHPLSGTKSKEELIDIIGQRPTHISHSSNSNNDSLEEFTIVIYKYRFPPFYDCFKFNFTNNVLTGQNYSPN